jgi:hypothetical protein
LILDNTNSTLNLFGAAMQIKEDREKNLFRLNPVERSETGDDIKFIQSLMRTVRLRGLFVFDSVEPARYFNKEKSRLALRFKSGRKSEGVHLIATDREDERIMQQIIFVLVDGNPNDRRPRGIYLYDYGLIENDHRHHLNGHYASICLGFCQHCLSPLIDRLEVRERVCKPCSEMSPDELLNLIEVRKRDRELNRPGFRGVWSRFKRIAEVAGSL